jgi:hypothetical protein
VHLASEVGGKMGIIMISVTGTAVFVDPEEH